MKASEIRNLLPAVYQQTLHDSSPLQTLLEVMEGQHAPSELVLERLHENFDPERAPAAMLGYLATWLDLDRFRSEVQSETPRFPTEDEILGLRSLIGRASTLSRWRGTSAGLVLCLELATGCHGFRVEAEPSSVDGEPLPFRMLVRAPRAAQPQAPLIQRIVSQEKPAHVACRLVWLDDTLSDDDSDEREEA